ncbi:hypothetical protein GCM10011415_07660 [Salipiger pallidus]|uniref:Dynamin family protein n=1 Tax=Salipiger pallidus TaxID=1775170 RepID=A0A8J3EFD2_9RHOB|nr:hypothetical protein [Salipiger pallidus]GGG63661.1 hypothetical protein GCM10011415_07660 [Salipiger pallidus]
MTDANRAARRPAAPRPARLPRILVAGEFSSGKTQLISGLLGEAVLPSNVVSTALPPIWLVSGSGLRVAIAHDGTEREVDGIEAFDLATTAFGVVAHGAPILDSFEIIDTPGNSDPNIPPETWQRMVDYADAVVWCTNATQAWRQSEKAVWQDMPQVLRDNATLLVTHADRLQDQRSVERVMRRVTREAKPFFSSILLGSTLSDRDVARVLSHLRDLVPTLPTLPGVDAPQVRRAVAIAARRQAAAQADGTSKPAPRRVSVPAARDLMRLQRHAAASGASADAKPVADSKPATKASAAPTPAPKAAPRTAPAATPAAPACAMSAPVAPPPLAPGMGRARALWRELGGSAGLVNTGQILNRIERFIDLLDHQLAVEAAASASAAARDDTLPARSETDRDEIARLLQATGQASIGRQK